MQENGASFQSTEIFVCLFYIPFENIFAYIEISPLPVMDFKIKAIAQRLSILSREGSLSCHTCCDTGPSSEKSVHMHILDTSIQKLYFYPGDCDNFV